MRKIFFVIIIFVALVILSMIVYYSNVYGSIPRPQRAIEPYSALDLLEYFPMDKGLRWEYEVVVGSEAPFTYSCISDCLILGEVMPLNKAQERTNRIIAPEPYRKNGKFSLVLEVANTLREYGPDANVGVEIFVTSDELRIFKDAKQIFWILKSSYTATVIQLAIYSLYDLGNGINLGRGLEYKSLFGNPDPLGGILSFSGTDRLIFVGKEQGLLHFARIVSPTKSDALFVEHTFFQRNKGLVKLIQESLDGKTLMTWNLINLTMGPPQ